MRIHGKRLEAALHALSGTRRCMCDICGQRREDDGRQDVHVAVGNAGGLKTIEKGEFCSAVCVDRACLAYTSTKSRSSAGNEA